MKDEPFATIDTHIKCGNSLVCGTPAGFRLADYEKKAYPDKYRELLKLRKELARAGGPRRPRTCRCSARSRRSNCTARSAARWPASKRPRRRSRQEFTAQLSERWPSLSDRRPVPLGSRVCRGVRGPRRLRHRRRQSALGRGPLRRSATTWRAARSSWPRGQYDSYELFVELGRRLLHERGVFGFIMPDSITLPEHEPLRRMLLDEHDADAVGAGRRRAVSRRVPRGVLPLLRQPTRPSRATRSAWPPCARSTESNSKPTRSSIPSRRSPKSSRKSATNARKRNFAATPRAEFDIFGKDIDAPIVRQIDSPTVDWASLTEKGRGVEIGKSGEVMQCPYCYRWDNIPAKSKGEWPPKTCRHCGREYLLEKAAQTGEDHRRAAARKGLETDYSPANRSTVIALGRLQYIDTTKDGINYKTAGVLRGQSGSSCGKPASGSMPRSTNRER